MSKLAYLDINVIFFENWTYLILSVEGSMTLTAVKLVWVQIFASIGKVIAKKNGNNENLHAARPPDRPTDRPTARNHDSNTPLGFQPEG